MPRSAQHLALARQWEILKKLPGCRPGITCTELCVWLEEQGFKVSKRTVERDLTELSAIFGIACNDVSIPYGWHWLPGRQHEFGGIEMADAVSLCLAADTMQAMLPTAMLTALTPKIAQARKKLAALEQHPLAKWSKKVRHIPTGMPLRPPRIGLEILDAIYQALLEENQLEVHYKRRSGRTRELSLHPLAFIHRGPVSYLVATASDFDDVRMYAVHRIKSAEVTTRRAVVPDHFSLDTFLQNGAMEFGSRKPITLRARINDDLKHILEDTPIHPSQRIAKHKAGGWTLSSPALDSWNLEFWILSQGERITVLAPRDLRNRIHETHKIALENYETANP